MEKKETEQGWACWGRGRAEWAGSRAAFFFFFKQGHSGKVPSRRRHLNTDLPKLEAMRIPGVGVGVVVLKVRGSRYNIRSVPGVSGKARRLEESQENTGRGRSGVNGAAPWGLDMSLQDFGLDLEMLPLWKWACSGLDLKRLLRLLDGEETVEGEWQKQETSRRLLCEASPEMTDPGS